MRKLIVNRILIFIMVVASCNWLIAQEPIHQWDFEGSNPYLDKVSSKMMNYQNYKCKSLIESEKNTNVLSLKGEDCLLTLNALSEISDQISFAFYFKGSYFSYMSFPEQNFKFVFDYDYFQFFTVSHIKGKKVTDNWIIRLNGENAPSYSQLSDNKWHSIILRADASKGIKEIIVDGKFYNSLSRKMDKAERFLFSNGDGIKKGWFLDDLLIYNKCIKDETVVKLKSRLNQKFEGDNLVDIPLKRVDIKSSVDAIEYAPGYPRYNISLLDQLINFPLPRFLPGHNLNRNFSWLDINYLHRQYDYPLKKGFGKSDASYAAAIVEEMANFWNYYIEIPTLRTTEAEARKKYGSASSIEGALIKLANHNPSIPTASVMIQANINPSHFGYNRDRAYVYSENLPDEYYLRDVSGNPVIYKNKKWFSPLMPLDKVEEDGKVAGKYLNILNSYLKKPISYINENGELYGHIRPIELWNKDPRIVNLMKKVKLPNADFNGWFQFRIDSTYKSNLLKESGNPDAKFSMYDLSAAASDYWPSYKMRMNINSQFNGTYRSTPSFYPRTPQNWVLSEGPYLGYGMVAEGRKTEISLGVKRFAPFVAAGWAEEEANIRPAQWLALLKSMIMLGADFFHTGYFNITDSKGFWPNGLGPYNPSGYAYQVVMPSYAQAMFPFIKDFIENGTILKGNYSEKSKTFRFQGLSENHLIILRKLNQKYIIYGSIQPNSNIKGNIQDSVITEISLNGQKIKFPIRRQGSMYELIFGKDTTFIQLDGWHQKEHPSYWSKTIQMEAELGTLLEARVQTDYSSSLDFSSFTSYVTLAGPDSKVNIFLPLRKSGKYKIVIRARSKQSSSSLAISIPNKNVRHSMEINSSAWKEYNIVPSVLLEGQRKTDEYVNSIDLSGKGFIDIDYVKVIPF